MKNSIIFGGIVFLAPINSLASVFISSVLPNTDTDPDGEYIEIQNASCEDITLSGYTLTDRAGVRTFVFGEEILASHERRVLPHSETRLELNNRHETVFLSNSDGEIIDTLSYDSSQKNVPIEWEGELSLCPPEHTPDPDPNIPPDDDAHSGSLIDPNPAPPDTGTGMIDIPDDETSTGTTTPEDPFPIGTGTIDAHSLWYRDSDEDGKIDTIILYYDEILTGSVNVDAFFLSSATGGLYHQGIASATGYILAWIVEDSHIILSLLPSDFERETLVVNATTSSAIRLRTWGDIWVTTLSGNRLEPLYLTRSFDRYKSVVHPVTEGDSGGSGSGDAGNFPWPTLRFPEVIPTLQSPQDVEWHDGVFVCHRMPCRINLTFESIFGNGFPHRSYRCEIRSRDYTSDSCNPPEWKWESSDTLEFRLIHRASWNSRAYSWYIDLSQAVHSTHPTKPNQPTTAKKEANKSDTDPAASSGTFVVPHVIIQNPEHVMETASGVYLCETAGKTCSLNLKIDSIDPQVSYHWIYPDDTSTVTPNPRSKAFSHGEHTIKLEIRSIGSGEILGEKYIQFVVKHQSIAEMKPAPKSKNAYSSKKKSSKKSTKATSKKTSKKSTKNRPKSPKMQWSWSSQIDTNASEAKEVVMLMSPSSGISLSGFHSSLVAILLWGLLVLSLGGKPQE